MSKLIDETGNTYGRLTVLRRAPTPSSVKGLNAHWECLCTCGNVVAIRGSSLRRGVTKSCGCLNRQIITKHGMHRTPEHNAWRSMRHRCYDPDNKYYHRYGGRGIKVECEAWDNGATGFQAFYADMGPRPPGMTLERVDNNCGYSPSNCVWATKKEQAHNRCSNHNLTYQGETHCVAVWARKQGIGRGTIGGRVRSGWSVEDALETPTGQRRPK